MAFTNHDYRDITKDIYKVRSMLKEAIKKYSDVRFEFCEAVDALRKALSLPQVPRCRLDVDLQSINGRSHVLQVRTDVPSFGPQPYLALKTVARTYHHDNFDFQKPRHEWTYVFDDQTFPLKAIEKIGIAVNNLYGVTSVAVMDIEKGKVQKTYHGDH